MTDGKPLDYARPPKESPRPGVIRVGATVILFALAVLVVTGLASYVATKLL